MGFWYNNPHTAYGSNDTICNIIKAIKCLHKVNVEQTNALNAEIQARKDGDAILTKALNDETTERKAADYDISYIADNTSINIQKGID